MAPVTSDFTFQTLDIAGIESNLPDLARLAKVQNFEINEYTVSKMRQMPDVSALIARHATGEIFAFRLGHGGRTSTYHFWISAIDPDIRNLGIQRDLQAEQERAALALGYRWFEIRCKNTLDRVIVGFLNAGYLISGFEVDNRNAQHVVLRKELRA